MKCPCCGAENEDSAQFCRMCGTPVTIRPPEPGVGAQVPYPPPNAYYYQPGQPSYPPSNPGYYGPPGQRPIFNSTNAVAAIIFGFLCGLWIGGILAVFGLVKGGRADDLWAMGDWQGAYNAVKEGDKLVKIAWIVSGAGVLLAFLYFLFVFLFLRLV